MENKEKSGKLIIHGKEFLRGKINFGKSIKHTEIKNKLIEKENNGEIYSPKDLIEIGNFIIEIFDNQFTLDELLEGAEQCEVMREFMDCEVSQAVKTNYEVEQLAKSFTKGKK